jgi:hypothetical protein
MSRQHLSLIRLMIACPHIKLLRVAFEMFHQELISKSSCQVSQEQLSCLTIAMSNPVLKQFYSRFLFLQSFSNDELPRS